MHHIILIMATVAIASLRASYLSSVVHIISSIYQYIYIE